MLLHKLRRDLWRLRYQAATIALLVGCGIAALESSVASYESMRSAKEHYYAQAHFADVFVHLNRAPRAILDRIRDLPGVTSVEGRVAGDFPLEIPDSHEPVTAHFVSLDPSSPLNQVTLLQGRELQTNREVLLNQDLVNSWHLRPGQAVNAAVNGRRVALTLSGVATSPEFVYVIPKIGLLDPVHYGVAWMESKALADAMGMSGEVNDIAVQVSAGTDVEELIRHLDVLLEPFGGLGAVARGEHPSARLVEQKIRQQRVMAVALPFLFLAISAFLLNVLLSRIVSGQREQIATLKALGFRTRELLVHYLELSALICGLGVALGLLLGVPLGRFTLGIYQHYFHFPNVAFHLDLSALALGIFAAFGAATLGAWFAVRRAVAVPPAEAMRPEAPASYHPTLLERAGVHRFLSPAMRMIFRDLERKPFNLLLSAGSLALGLAIVVLAGALVDSINEMLHLEYEVSHREDLTVTLDKARDWRALQSLTNLPGVQNAEGERRVPVRLRAGPRSKTTMLAGLSNGSELHQLLDLRRRRIRLPEQGLALARVLAEELGVTEGSEVEIETLEGQRQTLEVPVARLVDDLLGLSGYMRLGALNALLDQAPSVNVVLLSVDRSRLDELTQRLRRFPAVSALSRPDLDRDLIKAQVADVYTAMQVLLAFFAAAIAVGVVYNNARIALEVRSRDLATLRILGFTRGELGTMLLGEQGVQLMLALWPGLKLGVWLSELTMGAVDKELLRVPATVSAPQQLAGVCVVLIAAMVSALLVRRQADRLDLVAVLKARD
jgi:putative ABC transport system permease protein